VRMIESNRHQNWIQDGVSIRFRRRICLAAGLEDYLGGPFRIYKYFLAFPLEELGIFSCIDLYFLRPACSI